jgi:hypothetical protein
VTPRDIETIIEEHARLERLDPPNWDATMATMVEDCFQEHPAIGLRYEGQAQCRRYYQDLFGAFPVFSLERDGQAFGDQTMVHWGTLAVVMERPWLGLEPTGRAARISSVVVRIDLDGDKLLGETVYYDGASFCEQLGLDLDVVRAAARQITNAEFGDQSTE